MTPSINSQFDSEISLRVHFKLESLKSMEEILMAAHQLKAISKPSCTVRIVDEHIWLGIMKKEQKIYSPHLHIELAKGEGNTTHINAKFGPDPALWTLFMFLHFGLALGFIALAMVGYANVALGKPIAFQLSLSIFFIFCWIGLYFFARWNRNRGKQQAEMLHSKLLQLI